MEPTGKALVTGASRGIGRAVALELATRGFEVIATMRDPSLGADLLSQGLEVRALDVTRPETIRMPEQLAVLVNNAGVEGSYLPVEHAPMSLWREIFETNVFGLVEVTRRALPALRANGGGVVCNVTSCSILLPMPLYAAYRASKAAVSALGESLRCEVGAQQIRVLEIQPGAIRTDMLAGSDRMPEAIAHPEYEALARKVADARSGAGDGVPAEQAAERIVDAILDDDSPLRSGCDPMSTDLLAAWRSTSDEELMAGMVGHFAAT